MHTNKFNNKVYIGITRRSAEDRWVNGKGYKRDQIVFYNAIKKYGWDGFEHIIFAEDATEQEAKCMEVMLIALYKSNCKRYRSPQYGYNMTDDGDGATGCTHSEEARKKLSDKAKERLSNKENHPMYGKRFSEETKEKMSKAHIGKRMGVDNPFYGKHHTEESVKKNKASHAYEAKIVGQYTKNGELISIFSSIHDAAKTTGINKQCISFCTQGKYQQAGGYIWKVINI